MTLGRNPTAMGAECAASIGQTEIQIIFPESQTVRVSNQLLMAQFHLAEARRCWRPVKTRAHGRQMSFLAGVCHPISALINPFVVQTPANVAC